MVFSSVFATLIKQHLSPFVDDLTASQLDVFAWSGKATLHDVTIKPNAFDSLKLPFRIVHGLIGRIDASVPWMNLYSNPIVIDISDVYVVAVPNSEIQYNEDDEKGYEWALKKSYLEKIENMKQKIIDEFKDKKESDGFFMKLVIAAVMNIQIAISNVHICYEDSTTATGTQASYVFQVGLSFSKLLFQTEMNNETSSGNLINKLVNLEGFSVYMNSKKIKRLRDLEAAELNEYLQNQISDSGQPIPGLEYILCPINFTSKAAMHRRPEADSYRIPIVDVQMKLDSFHLQLTNNQVATLRLLFDTIDRMFTAAPYRKWRPNVTIKEHPQIWWKFLFTATVETGIRQKKREFSWKNIKAICQKRKDYTKVYKEMLLGEITDAADLEFYEKELNLTAIVIARSQAEAQSMSILEARKIKSKKKGWFSGWWSSEKETSDTLLSIKEEFTAEEKQKLYKAIDYEENSLQMYPVEFIAYQFTFDITTFKVVIMQEETSLMKMEFDRFHFQFLTRPSSGNIEVKCALDQVTVLGWNNVKLLQGKEEETQFLAFQFEMNPLDRQFDFAVDLAMKSSYMLYDIQTINHLYQMLKPPEKLSEEISSYASYKLSDLKQITSNRFALALEKHKQLKLNINLEPSFVVVPKNADISVANSVVIVSFGKLSLTSKLVPKSNIRKVQERMAGETDKMTIIEEMRKLVYEKYRCHIENVQVILSDAANWKADMELLNTDRHMLCPFEIILDIGRSVMPQEVHFAKLELTGEIPKIEVKASDPQISQLLALFISLPYGPTIVQVSSTTKMSKMQSIYNNEVIDAANYATKAVEKLETVESKEQVEDAVSTDVADGGRKLSILSQADLVFVFKLKNITLSIYSGDRKADSALVQIQLVDLELNFEIRDKTITIDCSICDLQLDDIRPIRKKTGIRTMLTKLINTTEKNLEDDEPENKPILLVNICQLANERMITVTMSGFTYSYALDYMLAIVEVTTKAFNIPKDSRAKPSKVQLVEETGQLVKVPNLKAKEEIVNVISISLDKIEIIILQSFEVQDALACVFNCFAKIDIRLDGEVITISGQVSKINMSLANYLLYRQYGKLEEYIMSPTNLEIIGEIKVSKQQIKIDLDFSDINISISPEMVSVILGILSTMGSEAKSNGKKLIQECFTDDMLNPVPTDPNVWYLNAGQPVSEANEAINIVRVTDSQINLKMASIKVLIKSSGLHSQPLIRLSSGFTVSLLNKKKFEFNFKLIADYFNTALLAWEPLIEPAEGNPFTVQGTLDLEEKEESGIQVKLETTEILEVLLTKSSINALYIISSAFTSVLTYQKGTFQTEENLVVIRNSLGITLVVDLDNSNVELVDDQAKKQQQGDTKGLKMIKVIKTGEECHFVAKDIVCVRLLVDLLFSDSVMLQRSIVCSSSSIRCYFSSIKTYPLNETWKWIVQVHDTGSTKEIEFRSNTQIVNSFDSAFSIYSSVDEKVSKLVGTVEPFSRFSLPLHLLYGQEKLYIRPSDEFELSDKPADWRSIDLSGDTKDTGSFLTSFCRSSSSSSSRASVVRYLMMSCALKSDPGKYFNIKVRSEKESVLYEDTESLSNEESHVYSIKLVPFVILKNLLPIAVEFNYHPVEEEQFRMEPGDEKILPFTVFGTTFITYTVLNYLGRNWICRTKLPETGSENESHYYTFQETTEGGTETICLAVNYSIEKNSLVLSIFSPYWMINETSEDVTYQVDTEHVYVQKDAPSTTLYMLAFDPASVSKKNKLSLAIGTSLQSAYFPLNIVPYSGSLLLKFSSKKSTTLAVNVGVKLARFGLTKIIKVSSFYNIYNISKSSVEYSESGDEWTKIKSEESKPFFPANSVDSTNQQLCFRFEGTEVFSKHVSLTTSSQTLLPIGGGRYLFVEVDITELEAKIKLSDYTVGNAPVLIVNDLNRPLLYGQAEVTDWKKDVRIYTLPPKYSAYFCWIDPKKKREIVYQIEDGGDEEGDDEEKGKDEKGEVGGAEEQSINLDFDKFVSVNDCTWVTFFDNQQRVLVFTHNSDLPAFLLMMDEIIQPKLSLEFIMKGLGLNLINNVTKKDLLYLTINSTCFWEERTSDSKQFKAVSIKENTILEEIYQWAQKGPGQHQSTGPHPNYIVDFTNPDVLMLRKPRERTLRRLADRGLWLKYFSSDHITQYHLHINRLQIDNQLTDHIFEVAFSPVIVPKSISDAHDIKLKSFIEITAIVQKLGTVTRYKNLQVLVQEFMVQVDWGWISMINQVLDYEIVKVESTKTSVTKDLESILKENTLVEMQNFEMRKSYIDNLSLGPIKAHISVSMGDLLDDKFPFGLDFIIRFTGLTVGQINDSLIKLDSFERAMVAVSPKELGKQVKQHYKTQVYMQLYKLILGLDIIGNPMKLVLGITKGIGDFFYEPAVGIVHGPEEFAEGIVTGVRSLASGVLGGTAGALGRIGNRLGTGVAALTIDDDYQRERRERANRTTGFAESGKNLVRGFFSGITGVVMKPYEGASKDGVGGLIKGVGKGFVGFVAQPATGVIDFASGSLTAFNDVIDMRQVAKAVRPPRYFEAGHGLAPYIRYAADGIHILKTLSDGKYATEVYDYHLQTSSHHIVLLTKQRIFYLKKSMMSMTSSTWEVEWMEFWENCCNVSREIGKVRIQLKLKKKKTMLFFAGAKEHIIYDSNEDHIENLHLRIMQHVNSMEENAN